MPETTSCLQEQTTASDMSEQSSIRLNYHGGGNCSKASNSELSEANLGMVRHVSPAALHNKSTEE